MKRICVRAAVLAAVVWTSGVATGQTIIYVDDDAGPAGDGIAWATAYTHLQDAVYEAGMLGPPVEIRVAQGTYRPDLAENAPVNLEDRTASFALTDSVVVNGGYRGPAGGGDPDDREPETYVTVLSGDLLNGDNSHHVVTAGAGTLDGLTITAGNADGVGADARGGGIYAAAASLTVRGCTIHGNHAADSGGGIMVESASLVTVEGGDSMAVPGSVLGNDAGINGGGIACEDSELVLVGPFLAVRDNTAGARGGGVYDLDSTVTADSCIFQDNDAVLGGGVYNSAGVTLRFTNFSLTGNTATAGAGMYNFNGSDKVIEGGQITGNMAEASGGGIYNSGSSPQIISSTFSSNSAVFHGGAVYSTSNSHPTIEGCSFTMNTAGENGGAIHSRFSNSLLSDCVMGENDAMVGGAVYTFGDPTAGSFSIYRCTFEGNTADSGGAVANDSASPAISRCALYGNEADALGGGMFNSNSQAMVTNCLFSGNEAADGGGAANINSSQPTFNYCTFAWNTVSGDGRDVFNSESTTTSVMNSVLWGASPPPPDPIVGGTTTISYSDVQGGWSGAGSNNIDMDPMFADPDGADDLFGTIDDDLHVMKMSPVIDAGDPTAMPPPEFDLDGNDRFVDGDGNGTEYVDMGAYETQEAPCPADVDGNGDVGFSDILAILAAWGQPGGPEDVDGDGTVGFGDILAVLAVYGPCP